MTHAAARRVEHVWSLRSLDPAKVGCTVKKAHQLHSPTSHTPEKRPDSSTCTAQHTSRCLSPLLDAPGQTPPGQPGLCCFPPQNSARHTHRPLLHTPHHMRLPSKPLSTTHHSWVHQAKHHKVCQAGAVSSQKGAAGQVCVDVLQLLISDQGQVSSSPRQPLKDLHSAQHSTQHNTQHMRCWARQS